MFNEVIKVKNLSYAYPDGNKALENISFSIKKNESVALIGPNGAGKSTLLLALTGLIKGKGEIHINGFKLNSQNQTEVRQKIGLVFQDPDDQLFMPTVYDDVAFGPLSYQVHPEEVKNRVDRALEQVGLSSFAHRSPHHLSLGEKKRISIATVLSHLPEILLLDEPTSNLDHKSRRELIELLKELKITKLIATHDIFFAYEVTDRCFLIYQGSIVATGETRQLLNNEKLLNRYDLESISQHSVSVKEQKSESTRKK